MPHVALIGVVEDVAHYLKAAIGGVVLEVELELAVRDGHLFTVEGPAVEDRLHRGRQVGETGGKTREDWGVFRVVTALDLLKKQPPGNARERPGDLRVVEAGGIECPAAALNYRLKLTISPCVGDGWEKKRSSAARVSGFWPCSIQRP